MTSEECKRVFFEVNNRYKEEQRKKQEAKNERLDNQDFFGQFNGGRWCDHENRDVIDAMWTCTRCGMVLGRAGLRRDIAYNSLLLRKYRKYERPRKTPAPKPPVTKLDRVLAKYGLTEHREVIREDFDKIFGEGCSPKQHTSISVICYQLLVKNGVKVDVRLFGLPKPGTHGNHVRRTCYYALLSKLGWEMVPF